MASVKDVERLADDLEGLVGELRSELKNGTDFERLMQIADEISVALICTAMGLATAIPFSYCLASLNIRLRRLQDSLGSGLLRLLDYFRTGGV